MQHGYCAQSHHMPRRAAALGAAAVLIVLALGATPVGADPPANAHVCLVASWSSRLLAERHTFDLMAAAMPRTNWSVAILPGDFSSRAVVQGYVLHPRTCDVLIAAGGSSPTIALSPLVPTSTAWTDGSATSLELTSIANHPAFNRVIPADSIAGAAGANIAFQLGFDTVSVLCTNNAYGRSLTDAFTEALGAFGGKVDVARCWEEGATEAEVHGRVDQVVAQRSSRVVFLVGSDESMGYVANYGLHETSVIIMVESCTSTALLMPGSICAVYSPVEDRFNTFLSTLRARDVAPLLPEFAVATSYTLDALVAAQSSTSFYSALAHDGLQHAMRGVYTYPDANQTAHPTIAEYLRSFATEGLTGTVELDANGDRPYAPMKIMNSYVDAETGEAVNGVVGIATTRNVTLDPFTASAARPARWYWLNSSFSAEVVSQELPSEAAATPFPAWAIVVIAVVVLALVAAAAYAATRTDPLQHCPLDDAQPFSVLFVGLANEAALNDHFTPESVAAATAAMAKLVRKSVRAARCHEAQRVNEGTFMVVAKGPERALDCAARIALAVNGSDECDKLLVQQAPAAHDRAVSEVLSRRSSHKSSASADSHNRQNQMQRNGPRHSTAGMSQNSRKSRVSDGTYRSHDEHSVATLGPDAGQALRVTIGITHGFGTIDHDAEHGVLSYRGAVLAAAAAATDAGVPGQVVVTERLVDGIQEEGTDVPGSFDLYIEADEARAQQSSSKPSKRKAGGTTDDAETLYTYMVPRYPANAEVANAIESSRARRERNAGKQPRGGGAITSALTRAATGVAPRRCALAVVELAALRKVGGAGAMPARELTSLLSSVVSIAHAHKCHVHDVVGTSVLITANAHGPNVSVPSVRLAHCAHDLTEFADGLPDAGRLSVGLASGSAVAGAVDATTVVAGDLMHQALLGQACAAAVGVPCVLATPSLRDSDVAAKFVATAVDLAAAPVGGSERLVQLCVLDAERGAGDGEWLYHFKEGGGGDDGEATEDSWDAFTAGKPQPAATPATAAIAANPEAPDATPSPTLAHDDEIDATAIATRRLQEARAGGHATPWGYALQRSMELIGVRGVLTTTADGAVPSSTSQQ